MKKYFYGALLIIWSAFTGCGERKEEVQKHEEEGHDHGSESSGASYEEGKGIRLVEESEKALGLELMEVKEGLFQPEISLSAQIYRSSREESKNHGKERQGNAYATALILEESSTLFKPGQKIEVFSQSNPGAKDSGKIWRIDPIQLSTLGKAEVILEIPDPAHHWNVGDFIQITLVLTETSQKNLSIPRSAVLETSQGSFAFVKNGDYWLRTEIKTGHLSKETIEITEGLYEGDTIATKPVEALYLIELRSTKGGGHSH